MIKAAIFDLDGTLLDSSDMWNNLADSYLATLGIQPRDDLSEKIGKLTVFEAAKIIRDDYNIPYSAEEITRQVNRLAENFYYEEARLKSGVVSLLSQLQRRCIKMCIATRNDYQLTSAAISRLGISDYFEEIFVCDDYGGKESPEVYLAAAESMFASPAETIVFEDSLFAVETAKNAGFVTAAVMDISEPNQQKLKETADYYAETMAEYADNA